MSILFLKKGTLSFFLMMATMWGIAQVPSAPNNFAIISTPDTMRQDEYAELLVENRPDNIQKEGTGRERRATKLYKQLGYQASADLYAKMQEKGKLDAADMGRMAKSYRLTGDTENAEYWYSKIVNEQSEPSTIFYYAQALQSNGKCQDAVRWYRVFNKKVKKKEQVNLDFIKDCSDLQSVTTHETAHLTNISTINSHNIDYCAVPYKAGVVFTSTRGTMGLSKNTDNWTKESFSDIFYAEKQEDGSYGAPTALASDLNGRFHDGVASFTAGHSKMFFSRNNLDGKNKDGNIDLKIYVVEQEKDGDWTKATELPFNGDEFATCHPSVTSDGKVLYFASDRPGGFGGMDIYVSRWTGSTWSTPENVGPMINTVGNEVFPTIATDSILYFASNGHIGLGGLDIYAVEQKNGRWTRRANLGQPFNSEKDDLGFSCNGDRTMGFVSSNRDGGMGEDDIYEWQSTEPIDPFKDLERIKGKTGLLQSFSVVDKVAGSPVSKAIVTFEELEEENPLFYSTDPEGLFKHRVLPGKKFRVLVEKEGYEPYTEELSAYDLLSNPTDLYKLALERRACTEVGGVVTNMDCDKPLAEAEIQIFNKCTGEQMTIVTDRDGRFENCLKCGCDYEVIATKSNFTEDRKIVKTIRKDCDQAEAIEVELKVRSIVPEKKIVGVPAATELRVGSVFTLKNIYYDFDEYSIRPDASTDLNDLVALLLENPSMEIELGAHTDSRGSDIYNQKLSFNRATAAATYLIKRGIESYRIVAKGYGESQLANSCYDGVDCDEEEHQQNRRTEIRITKFDN